jgi:23S rRNA (guanosine2251-2'-O)-methyltransferase
MLEIVESQNRDKSQKSDISPDHTREFILLLDSIRSVYNVGAIFRTADGAGVDQILLAGTTPTPEHPRLNKTGLGSEWSVEWHYHPNALECALRKQQDGSHLLALERTEDSTNLFSMTKMDLQFPVLLIIGNEKSGVDPGILAIAEKKIHIPMLGYKRSLNVATAAGIAIYFTRFILLQD